MSTEFAFYRLRFHFEAIDAVLFPAGKSGNVVRGAFGRSFRAAACASDCRDSKICSRACSYRAIFEPRDSGRGPSGLADPPRPFVIRAREFDGRRVEAGSRFWFDLHLFDMREPRFADYERAFARFAEDGIGPGQARARLTSAEGPVESRVDLAAGVTGIRRVELEFVSPTELKSEGGSIGVPEFSVLFARLRDRLSTLRALYGEGPLEIDFREMGARAQRIALVSSHLHDRLIVRRSGRTGQTHGIGGFEGTAVYEGDLGEFIPYLTAGGWTGVGRQTVWGKGEIRVTSLL